MHSSRTALLLLAVALAAGCRDLPWRSGVTAYIADGQPRCPPELPACDPLAPRAADTLLLERMLRQEFADTAELNRSTGLSWRPRDRSEGNLHVRFPQVDTALADSGHTAYVLEFLRVAAARDTVLSIASNGGTTVWLNGRLLGSSRAAERPARAHQDLYAAPLQAGVNVVLYRVFAKGRDAQLHRAWLARATLPEALEAAILVGAYADLPARQLLPDTLTAVPLDPPQVRLDSWPEIRFRWLALTGEPLAEAGDFRGGYPDRLVLPAGFRGMAVLETEVADPATGRRLFLEQVPIFSDSTATRLARALTAGPPPAEPVLAARRQAVRRVFGLDSTALAEGWEWHKVHVLADLYRRIEQPESFHRHPGPQVWGYRAANDSVQPYWLVVPPSRRDTVRPGLVFSLVHFTDPDYWRGRGSSAGWLVHMATIGAVHGNYGAMPHLQGSQEFAAFATAELPAITRQVDSVFGIDTAAVGALAWSSHATEMLRVAQRPDVPLAWLGVAVPSLPRALPEFEQALDSVRAVRPDLHWVIWHASEDDRIPRERTERWVAAIRARRFPVSYRVVPYSTHLGGFFDDVEAELHRRIAARDRDS